MSMSELSRELAVGARPPQRRKVQVLVFSAWNDVLSLLAHALRAVGVPHLQGKGKAGLRDALSAFCSAGEATGASVRDRDVTAHLDDGASTSAAPAGRRRSSAGGGVVRAGQKRKRGAAPRVLLLQLKQAAAGLNLTEAQHALLVEPSTNPATEAQVRCTAIVSFSATRCRTPMQTAWIVRCDRCGRWRMQAVARIHRMNQARETQVLRFVVDDTVEASLHRLTSAKAARMDMSGTALAGAKVAEPPLTLSDVATMLFDPKVAATAAQ